MAGTTESYAGKIQRKLLKKQRVIEAASGRQKADLVLKNATENQSGRPANWCLSGSPKQQKTLSS